MVKSKDQEFTRSISRFALFHNQNATENVLGYEGYDHYL